MIDASYYDELYFNGGTKSHYNKYGIAYDMTRKCEEIIQKYRPKRLLDVGCAYGFYVFYFRSKGIDAYGIDISKYAISQAHDLVKRYVFVADAQAIPFPTHFFDLVVSWDVLEHINEADVFKTTTELNRVGERQYHVIATEKLSDDKDRSHITMKPLSWWKTFLPTADLVGSKGEHA